MRNVALMCAALALSACAQSFLKGARISSRNLAQGDEPDFTLGECVETGTNAPAPADAFRTPVNGRRGGEYSLVEFNGGTGLFERVSGGSYVINNTWREADGTHYFTWVLATGWEFIIPDSGNGRRLMRRGGSVRAADGTGRPTNKPPVYECELIRRGGSPTGVTSAPPPPLQAQPQSQPSQGTRVATTAVVAPAPVQADTKAPIQKGSSIVITLNNGTEVKGTLLSETATGFLVKGSAGTRLVKFEDVADIKGASATPPPAAPAPTIVATPVPTAPPQPVGPKTTRVSLFSKDAENWTVKVGESTCATPCTLQLVPGAYPVEATREGETVKGNVAVPDYASHIMVQRPGSNAVKMAGFVTIGVGVLTLLAGLIIDPASHTRTGQFSSGTGYQTIRYTSYTSLYPAVWLPIGGTISLTGFFIWLGAALDHGKVALQRGEPRRLSELLAPMPAGFTAGAEQ